MAVYIQNGHRVDYLNSEGGVIEANQVVAFGGTRIGIAEARIFPGEEGAVAMTGVYELPADSAQAYNVGDLVYWDEAAGQATSEAQGVPAADEEGGAPLSTPTKRPVAGMVLEKKAPGGGAVTVRLC